MFFMNAYCLKLELLCVMVNYNMFQESWLLICVGNVFLILHNLFAVPQKKTIKLLVNIIAMMTAFVRLEQVFSETVFYFCPFLFVY